MIENQENVERKNVTQKRDGTETKNEVFLADFFVVLSEEREELIQQIKNRGKIKRIFSEQLDFSDFGLVSSVVFIWLLFVYVS